MLACQAIDRQALLLDKSIDKRPDGFTVKFDKRAPQGAKLDWLLFRTE